MDKLFDVVSNGITGIVNNACNNRTIATPLSQNAFFPMAYMSEMMSRNDMPMKMHDFAARCINLVGLGCKIMNTHQSDFTSTETYFLCKTFISNVCDELGMPNNDYQRKYWLDQINNNLHNVLSDS
ncbi:hypothetical protein GNP73_07990 [Aliivibrio fischeri]|uniref:hypothetical protein n=1 Tax=Aliivibrio fischeri TaxID=668 RepID=UPI001414C29A|nr:hypothetical protein [Aliivibrio fischeri]MUJ27918.1 hypothetical protein [Aliivibrio fischeri]